MLAYAASKVTTRFSLPAAGATFSFIVAAGVAQKIIQKLRLFNGIMQKDALFDSNITILGTALYGLHTHFNPEKTLGGFAKLSVLAAISLFGITAATEKREFSMDPVELHPDQMFASVFHNAPYSLYAGAIAWMVSRFIHRLELDPKATLVFTATMSVLYYTTNPLFNRFDKQDKKLINKAFVLLHFAKFTAGQLEIKTVPSFAKTCAIAGAIIALFDSTFGFPPTHLSYLYNNYNT